jgi:hypothetical protein
VVRLELETPSNPKPIDVEIPRARLQELKVAEGDKVVVTARNVRVFRREEASVKE